MIRTTGATSTLDYGVFNDVDIRTEARFDDLTTEFTQITLDGSHDFENGLKVHGLAGMAESNHDNPKQTTLLFDSNNIDGYTYDYRGSKNRLPFIGYGTTDVTDPSDLDHLADPAAAADGGQFVRQLRRRPCLRSQREPGAERRIAIQAVRVQDHGAAPVEWHDREPWRETSPPT